MARKDQPAPGAVSRTLVLGWCLWLMVSWSLNVGLFPARGAWHFSGGGGLVWGAAPETFVPLVRGMLLSILAGMMLIWPAWRLGQRTPAWQGRRTAMDLFALWLVAQVVIWPMRLLAGYPVVQLGLMSLALLVWGGAAAVLVWFGRRGDSPVLRTGAMLGCVAVMLGALPVALVISEPWVAALSPVNMLWALAGGGVNASAVLVQISMIGAVVIVFWMLGFLAAAGQGAGLKGVEP